MKKLKKIEGYTAWMRLKHITAMLLVLLILPFLFVINILKAVIGSVKEAVPDYWEELIDIYDLVYNVLKMALSGKCEEGMESAYFTSEALRKMKREAKAPAEDEEDLV